MNVRMILTDDVAPQAWRNGGGFTRELFAWPRADVWRVRVSVADIDADGPFSPFPGVERWFAVVQGDGVELTVAGTTHRLTTASAPLRFGGDEPASCRLVQGPTRDLNLMLRGVRGGVFRAEAGQPWRPRASQCGLFTTAEGRCVGDAEHRVAAGGLLWFDVAPASLVFLPAHEGDAAAWWLAATPQERTAWA